VVVMGGDVDEVVVFDLCLMAVDCGCCGWWQCDIPLSRKRDKQETFFETLSS
jgi:hypothetical protein